MKTTLVLDDVLVEQVRKLAKERGTSMSSVVEDAIFRMLHERPAPPTRLTLPTYPLGRANVDINDRDALYDFMEDL